MNLKKTWNKAFGKCEIITKENKIPIAIMPKGAHFVAQVIKHITRVPIKNQSV